MNVLQSVEKDLEPIRQKLVGIAFKYKTAGHDRIAWEVLQAAQALNEPISLAKLYLSGEPLPTVEEVQAIYKALDTN